MKKYSLLLLIIIMCFSLFVPASFAETKNVEVAYGKTKINLTLVDDFENSVAGSTQYGTVTVEDSAIILSASSISDIYGITAPDSVTNKALFAGATYIALSVTSTSDDELWFCFQPNLSGQDNKFLAPNTEDKVYLLDKSSVRTEAEWCGEDELVNARLAFTLPELFEGYVLIPVKSFTNHKVWDTPIWKEGDYISGVGFHAMAVSGGSVELKIDAMYVAKDIPTYEAAPTSAPSPTPEQTNTPEPTSTPSSTATPLKTNAANDEVGISAPLKIAIIVASSVIGLAIVGFIVLKVVKTKKK